MTLEPSRVIEGHDPFSVDPGADHLLEPRHDIALWSETMFFVVWSPEQGVGLWLHLGVMPTDKGLWWAQTYALLPDGVALVDRSFGRPADRRGPSTGNLRISCTEPGRRWALSFDGAGEVSSTDALASRPAGDGVAAPLRFDVELEALLGVYDMHAAMGRELDWRLGGIHHEQAFAAQGSLTALGTTWEIDGVGARDHSAGERDFSGWGGHVWTHIVWPSGRALGVMAMWSAGGESLSSIGVLMERGRTEVIDDLDITGMERPGGHPRAIELAVVRADGTRLDLRGEVLHNVSMTYGAPNHNLNGCFVGREDSAVLIADESITRWAWPDDGELGYSDVERAFRPEALPLTRIPLPAASAFRQQ